MTDADVEAAQHAKTGKDDEGYPEDAPVNRQLRGNCCRVSLIAPLLPQGKCKRQQSQKAWRRFQQEQDRKIEPHAVGISVTQNERGSASGEQNEENAAQV